MTVRILIGQTQGGCERRAGMSDSPTKPAPARAARSLARPGPCAAGGREGCRGRRARPSLDREPAARLSQGRDGDASTTASADDVVGAVFKGLVTSPSVGIPFLFALLALALTSANAPNWYALIADVNPPEHRGTVYSLGNLANGVGRATGNSLVAPVFNALAARFPPPLNLAIGPAAFQIFFIPTGLMYWRASRTSPRDIETVHEMMHDAAAPRSRTGAPPSITCRCPRPWRRRSPATIRMFLVLISACIWSAWALTAALRLCRSTVCRTGARAVEPIEPTFIRNPFLLATHDPSAARAASRVLRR